MQYTKYFSILTKDNGQPNLNTEQFRRMMNIVSVEGVIVGMAQIKRELQKYFKLLEIRFGYFQKSESLN